MGVEDDHVFKDVDKSFKEFGETFELVRKKIKAIEDEEIQCTLIVYVSGYSVSVAE